VFTLGKKSRAELVGVHPKLVRVVELAIAVTLQDFTAHDGLRSTDEQARLLAAGASKVKFSKHQKQADGWGHAVDLVPIVMGKPRWEWPPIYKIAEAVRQAAVAEDVPVRWGGVWDRVLNDLPPGAAGLEQAVAEYCRRHPGPDFIDGPHYELIT